MVCSDIFCMPSFQACLLAIRQPMTTTNDLKNGLVLNIDGQLWTVSKFQHINPGKGQAFVRTTLKNVLSGKVIEKNFNAGVKVETASVDRRQVEYLYHDGDDYVFMDSNTFEQLNIPRETLGDVANFLVDNQEATVALHGDVPLYVELPASVAIEIQYTEPGVQGDRSSGGTKPATLSTGYEIQVPLFVKVGDRVRVDTRSGDYLGRVAN
jgi:elongation factor P